MNFYDLYSAAIGERSPRVSGTYTLISHNFPHYLILKHCDYLIITTTPTTKGNSFISSVLAKYNAHALPNNDDGSVSGRTIKFKLFSNSNNGQMR